MWSLLYTLSRQKPHQMSDVRTNRANFDSEFVTKEIRKSSSYIAFTLFLFLECLTYDLYLTMLQNVKIKFCVYED